MLPSRALTPHSRALQRLLAAMDRLPRELVDEILLQCVNGSPKNTVLPLRLVCRQFDRTLKPYACRTLGLEFSRLSKSTNLRRPQMDALQTIGYHCKCLYVDLMVLRDECKILTPTLTQLTPFVHLHTLSNFHLIAF